MSPMLLMEIADIRFYGSPRENFICYVSAVINKSIVLKHMRLVTGREGRLVLSMPSRQAEDGQWKEIYHPIRREVRARLEQDIFAAYTKQKGGAVEGAGA